MDYAEPNVVLLEEYQQFCHLVSLEVGPFVFASMAFLIYIINYKYNAQSYEPFHPEDYVRIAHQNSFWLVFILETLRRFPLVFPYKLCSYQWKSFTYKIFTRKQQSGANWSKDLSRTLLMMQI